MHICFQTADTCAHVVNSEMSVYSFLSSRDDCSIFDGLMEEDEKDKAKRWDTDN